ncbi:hypothetical protein BIY40_07655 [Pediococcus acidilactici]|nr:hypothetical protein BIY40_07655 [Pediococcus acidilactici]
MGRAGNYTVDIWYTDDLTGQKVSTTVTVVAQENKGHIEAHNVDTWQGQPLDPSEAVDNFMIHTAMRLLIQIR